MLSFAHMFYNLDLGMNLQKELSRNLHLYQSIVSK
jgi:hypothetical protein